VNTTFPLLSYAASDACPTAHRGNYYQLLRDRLTNHELLLVFLMLINSQRFQEIANKLRLFAGCKSTMNNPFFRLAPLLAKLEPAAFDLQEWP